MVSDEVIPKYKVGDVIEFHWGDGITTLDEIISIEKGQYKFKALTQKYNDKYDYGIESEIITSYEETTKFSKQHIWNEQLKEILSEV